MFGDMVVSYMPNSEPRRPPGSPFMTIFVFYVNPQIPNIENFDVYGGLWSPGGMSSFVSSNFPSNGVRIMSGDPFLIRVITFSTFFVFCWLFGGPLWCYLVLFGLIRFYLFLFGLIWSYLVLFDLIWFHLVLFGLIWS